MLKQNNIDFSTLVFNDLIRKINPTRSSGNISEFRKKEILGYKYFRSIKEPGNEEEYTLHVYKNSKRETAFVKTLLTTKEFSNAYLYLLNEINVYKFLEKNNFNTDEIRIPKFIGSYEDKESLSLIVEYIDFDNKDFEENKKIEVYDHILKKLKFIYENNQNNNKFSKRTPIQYLILMPFLALKYILIYPQKSKDILTSFLTYLLTFKNEIDFTITHRDLDFPQILKSNNKYYLIDLETVTAGPYIHDYMNTLRTLWAETNLRNKFITYMENKFKNSGDFVYNSVNFGIENILHHLDETENMDANFEMLKYLDEKINKKIAFSILLRKALFNLIYTLFKKINKNKVDALCYHNISSENNHYSIKSNTFIKQINKISKDSKFGSSMNIEKYLSEDSDENNVLITFDDGFYETKDTFEFLLSKNIPVLLFALSDPDNADRGELENNSRIYSLNELKELSDMGVTIGCHTATHKNLTQISDDELEKEIINSKKVLEQAISKPVEYFAYPKGKYNDKVIEYVKKAGYKAAFSVDPGSIDSNANKWALPRYIVDNTHQIDEFPAMYSHSTGILKKFLNRFNVWERFLQ